MKEKRTLEFSRLELRILNFALTFAFWLNSAHYSKDTAMTERSLCKRISEELSGMESEIDFLD